MRKMIVLPALLLALAPCVWAQDIETGLEAYWSFNETEGETAADLSGNGRDAVVRNGLPVWAEDGKIGGAVEFFGADDFSVPGWKGIGGDAPRTIAYWTKTDWVVDASSGIVGWGLSTENGTKWHTRLNQNADNGLVGAIRTEIQGSYIIGTTVINDGEWHHVASVLIDDGFLIEDIRHYIDGVEEGVSGNGATDVIINTEVGDLGTEVEIGSRLQGEAQQYYIGMVDEARIYSRALTPEDIQVLVEQGASNIGEWNLY